MERYVIEESEIVQVKNIVLNGNLKDVDMDTGRILGLLPVLIILLVIFIRIAFVIYKSAGQKTRNSQQRRTYMGSRQRPSETPTEPTIYVSPANLPPPPKYEAMAPPSYEEVVGIHYPNFQPISQPITTALAQSSNTTETTANNNNVNDNGNNEINVNNENNVNNRSPSVVISVPVVASS
ncbi:homeobox protein 4-like isoform X1 [Danaus plexippus]|uniref:homeobox protein 4-like isoform X1 n=1 Tax=Danaus plexippus TaxID=13037 RepID=UPI002AAFB20A|nr:homeobox protein 4-like isoform X1 [Danaus plexippus]